MFLFLQTVSEMSSRNPKDLIKSKWGSKAGNSKSETALEKFRGEIAALKTSVDEITSGKGKLTDKDRHRLLEVNGLINPLNYSSFTVGNEEVFSQQ